MATVNKLLSHLADFPKHPTEAAIGHICQSFLKFILSLMLLTNFSVDTLRVSFFSPFLTQLVSK